MVTNALQPTITEWQMMREQASILVKTGFLPRSIDTPEKAVAIMLKGREMGIPPMQAFSQIHVIAGKPTLSPELMLGLIFKQCPGTKVVYKQNDDLGCIIRVTRPGHPGQDFSFSMADAKRANLTGKDTWKMYPRAMLRSRCIAEMARSLFPDVIMGSSYTPEEMGAEINEEGEVLSVTANPIEPIKIEEKKVDPKPAKKEFNAEATIRAFGALGVAVDVLEKTLGHAVADCNEDEIKTIRGIYAECAKDGAKIAEHFGDYLGT